MLFLIKNFNEIILSSVIWCKTSFYGKNQNSIGTRVKPHLSFNQLQCSHYTWILEKYHLGTSVKKSKKNFFVRKNQKFRELHNGVFQFSMRCLIIILCLNLCLYFKPAALAVWKVLVGNFIWFRYQAERTRNFKIQVVLWTSRTGTTPGTYHYYLNLRFFNFWLFNFSY